MKIITLGQIAVACFKKDEETDYNYFDVLEESVISRGFVKDMARDKAGKIAPLHPRFIKYYEAAMMPLWKGKGILSDGTEDPTRAVKSYFPKDTHYYIAWRPLYE